MRDARCGEMSGDPRSECLEWSRAQADARADRATAERLRKKRRRKKEARRAAIRHGRMKHTVAGMHERTGLWIGRVRNQNHVTLRAYGITSAAGVFAAVALDRVQVARLHQRLGNILEQWKGHL